MFIACLDLMGLDRLWGKSVNKKMRNNYINIVVLKLAFLTLNNGRYLTLNNGRYLTLNNVF
jgi:hypothetical protein